jgi:hypothetical protein
MGGAAYTQGDFSGLIIRGHSLIKAIGAQSAPNYANAGGTSHT